jgi:SAM-dependent methyltransferase
LAPVYSWILGNFESAYHANVEMLGGLGLSPEHGELAVDLGCGPGCQSLPLAELGYRVVAIDFCQELLDELTERSGDLAIKAVCADLGEFQKYIDEPPGLIVCMGDTLVHLPDEAAVEAVIDRITSALKPGGTFVYSIRDYVTVEPAGAERFVPVRADDEQIFTCFLDYRDSIVHVHDVLYRKEDGDWTMHVSDYLKLRLDTAAINLHLQANGLVISQQMTVRGMIYVVATKPADA